MAPFVQIFLNFEKKNKYGLKTTVRAAAAALFDTIFIKDFPSAPAFKAAVR
jgi:hypothetical protein